MSQSDSRIVEQLRSLGLGEREAKVYYALLRKSESTAATLTAISGVPRTKLYEVLTLMTTDGLCSERQEGRKKYYRATPPKDVITRLKIKWEKEHQVKRETADTVVKDLSSLHRVSKNMEPDLENIEVIRSQDQGVYKAAQLIENTKDEIIALVRPPFSVRVSKLLSVLNQANTGAFDRGVKSRAIYMADAQDMEWMEPLLLDLASMGEEIRLLDELPLRMMVFDRRVAAVELTAVPGVSGADFTTLVVEDPGFVTGYLDLFELYWKKAKPFKKRNPKNKKT